jgi:dihydroorotate dehydrogenase (fumarate)
VHTRAIWSSRWSRSARAGALVIALAASFVVSAAAHAAPAADDLPAATAAPVERDGPGQGQWFSANARPGQTLKIVAQVQNPADVPQHVKLYLTDLGFQGDQPQVGDPGAGVGAWGAFADPERDLPAHALVDAPFTVTVPDTAEPGDHIGAVVVESQATASGAVNVVKRVASRLYVTVPGPAETGVVIESASVRLAGSVLPRHATVTAIVRNTGDVSLQATVTVNGHRLSGSNLVLTHSAERYTGTVPVSPLGGRRQFRVHVRTTSANGKGPEDRHTEQLWIVPWWLLVALFLAVVGFFAGRELQRRLR